MKHRSLEGIRIIDFSWVMAGPMATKMLGAMGAEVIKIESSSRPEFSNRNLMFSVINNNKKSCTINIASPEGQQLIRDLVAGADIVIENFSARVMGKFGLDYESLKKIRPGLIFLSASGVGRTGPERDMLAYGSLLQGYSGRVGMIGTPNAALEAMGVMPAWTDPITALWEVLAALAALRHRADTGEGAFIDMSMLEGTVALLPESLLRSALGQAQGEAHSTGDPHASPSACFRCAGEDEWLAVSVRTDDEWRRLCSVMENEGLSNDPLYAGIDGRRKGRNALNSIVSRWMAQQDAADMEARLLALGVPAARSRNMEELVADQTLQQRGLFRVEDGMLQMATLPWRTTDGWTGDFVPTPALGADNAYVFGTLLGLDESRRRELAEAGVIG